MLKVKVRGKHSHDPSVRETARAPVALAAERLWPGPGEEFFPPALARRAVESSALERRVLRIGRNRLPPLLSEAAACFVCLKTTERRLRGCIGTVTPTERTLAEEIVANAVNAASRDPRFPPVRAEELSELRFTVDVLEMPEPARMSDLDPSEFGVIVEDTTGRRRGLLLPAIDGVETALEQVQIAARKAGLAPGEPHQLYRFRVRRFREAF